MTLIGIILYIAGYTFDFEKNVYVPPLDIELGGHNTYVARPRTQKKESIRRLILTTTYKIIIYMLILWLVPYSLYMAIRDKNVYTFGRSWFQVLIALQHYYATAYFSNNHFYENIMCNTKLKKYMRISSPCMLILSIMLSCLNVILLNFGFRYNGYDEILKHGTNTGKAFISILLFFNSFYSYITFTINSCVFVINMMYHQITVSNYSDSLDNYIKNSMNVVRKINIIAMEFSQMKYMFDKTVEMLTPFFSVLNFVGFATLYFYLNALQKKNLTVPEYINIVLFVIVECLYIQAIQAVNVNISNISDAVTSNSMIATFFGNKRFDRTMPLMPLMPFISSPITSPAASHVVTPTATSFTVRDRTTSTTSTIPTIPTIPSIPKIPPLDLNVQRHDQTAPTLASSRTSATMRLAIFTDLSTNIKTEMSTNNAALNFARSDTDIMPSTDHNEYYKYADDAHSKSIDRNANVNVNANANANMMKQIMIASISTEQMLDWLVLGNIVSAKWTTFTVFGIEFTDTTLLSKLFGAAGAIVMTAEVGNILSWW